MTKKSKIIFCLILIVFIFVRFSSIHQPYHQDEMKWIIHATTWGDPDTGKGQPPMSGIVFSAAGKILGDKNMRILPLVFGVLNLVLLYFLVRRLFGRTEALWAAALFSFSYYSVLASLMIDIDGQFLPFFVLLSFLCFLEWLYAPGGKNKMYWGLALTVSIVLGFLVKLNFVVPVMAMAIFYLIENRSEINKKGRLVKLGTIFISLLAVTAATFLAARYLMPSFNLQRVFEHATDYFGFRNRDYGQVLFQACKAIFYASPLLLIPLLSISKVEIRKLRLFILFLLCGIIFYFVLFDFSRGALDKYLSFIVLPLSIIGGVVIKRMVSEGNESVKPWIVSAGTVVLVFIFFAQFLPHIVPALYPKSEWISRVIGLKWNFLLPFTGGSGPMGFYVSFLFMALVWVFAISALILSVFLKNLKKSFAVLIIIAGILYNLVFIEEYAFGRVNGNPSILLENAVRYIKNNPRISRVITYNDIGGYELFRIGKYERRIYVAPKFDKEHVNTLNNFKGYYLVIDIPKLNPESMYARYFSTCKTAYEDFSGKISAKIYDCKKAITLPQI